MQKIYENVASNSIDWENPTERVLIPTYNLT